MQDNNNQSHKSDRALREEAVLEFWKNNDIFQKSLEKNKDGKPFVFFEGPPTANAKPALHHLEARAFKDVIPRYKTMRGFNVPRRAGWDTHGLPVELQIEKKLELNSKKAIEEYGIAKFNKACRESVFEFIGDWEKFTDRIGYWVDKEKAYYTFDTNYIESLWNIVGRVDEQNLLYKDYKIVPWCPRCGTPLASHELAQGYQDVKDLTVYAKFKVKIGQKIGDFEVPENTYLLAWTTTPWTLPGNVALAVGADIEYVEAKVGEEIFVLAKERLSVLGDSYEIIAEHKGSEMAGMEYIPLYPYLKNTVEQKGGSIEHAFKVYTADFVTTTDGTGIVHIAPMYGQDDFELGTKNNLPKMHTVNETGMFIEGTDFLSGRFAKDEEVAIDIIKDLAGRGLLFKKEKYEHSYPHCWRCKTPLLYYARDSWYINVEKLRDTLVSENESINWEPAHIQQGRFGEWLRNIKDWAISRERYWGTPLPVWMSADGEKIVVDSFDTLKKYTKKSGNKYFIMRHGETQSNIDHVWSCDVNGNDPVLESGIAVVKENAEKLKNKDIDLILVSPFMRTRNTAEAVAEVLGIDKEKIIVDERLGEWQVGDLFERKSLEEYFTLRNASDHERYSYKVEGGESYRDVVTRSGQFLYDIEQTYAGKNILIVSHGAPLRAIETITAGFSYATLFESTRSYQNFANAEIRELDFVPLPHNENYELDPHRPFIDEVILEKDGKEFRRVKEVMDVWFDSGAMPFAQDHYPFEHKKDIDGGLLTKGHYYPADFISEAIDQTRGWFYTLHAVGALMGKGKAYKNVICLGHLLDAEGKKMSKSIGNIVDPWMMMDKYGVDTLRLWMYSVNQPGDSKNFDEKTVKELEGKVFTLYYNVLSFYEMYRDVELEKQPLETSSHVLDQWILARLNQYIENTTNNLDKYKLFEPVRELRDFIGDLSTWYLRRSRDRIKDGDKEAKATLYVVLKTLVQVMAPFAPFAAEDVWQKLKTDNDAESVHLSEWPEAQKIDTTLLEEMEKVREICTEGNALRKKSGIPVRQPLQKLTAKIVGLENYLDIIKDELNVKEIVQGEEISLDTEITLELKREGDYRELIREIQDARKEKGLSPSDTITLTLRNDQKEIIVGFEDDLKKTVGANEIVFVDIEEKCKI